MKLNIPAAAVNFTAPFVAKADIRHYLTGLFVRPMTADEGGGVLIAGCNGHALGMWRDDADTVCERPAILRITPGLLAACRKNPDRRRVTVSGNRLTVVEIPPGATAVVATEVYVQPATDWVEGTSNHQPWEIAVGPSRYPDILSVGPEDLSSDRGPTCKLNTHYVELAAKAFSAGSGKTGKRFGVGINLLQAFAGGAVLAVSEDLPQAVAIIMPLRAHGEDPVPKWLGRAKAAAGRVRLDRGAPLPVHEPSDAGPPDGDGKAWDMVEAGGAA